MQNNCHGAFFFGKPSVTFQLTICLHPMSPRDFRFRSPLPLQGDNAARRKRPLPEKTLLSAQEKYHGGTGGYSPYRGMGANAGRQQKIRSGIFPPKMTGAGQQVVVIGGFWRARNSLLHNTVMELRFAPSSARRRGLIESGRKRDGTLPAPAAT